MIDTASVLIARNVRTTLASRALTERQAKLYSQRLRRDMGQEGLASFAPSDVDTYLDDAILLLECGLLERNADPSSAWRNSIKRAAEILEWLSQASLRPAGAPLHFLAAAAYQLADYPAMALGHLRQVPDEQPFSGLLREFLRANFPGTLDATSRFWHTHHALELAKRIDPTDITTQTFQNIVMCIGTICAYMRTGNDEVTERALAKLERLAASLLHSCDPYSYLLAKLTAATGRRFIETALWLQIDKLRSVSSEATGNALVQYTRLAFTNRRALVWPSQTLGIERLSSNSSFALCTPTGSGKTTVATLGIIQSLFSKSANDSLGFGGIEPGNTVLYIVPSRALAAEVESRLAEDLKGLTAEPIVVTGLYGGVDWGPTDAWIQRDQPTIVICTFEKADALLRYLGVLFLSRVRLVVIDEAHMVEQNETALENLGDGTSRPYRLEQLGTRLLQARETYGFRILALSAVAAQAAPALARWISDTHDTTPTTSSYRSTRQMLGRLEVNSSGHYTIRYDLMDGRSLKFDDERSADTPFVRNPFQALPRAIDTNLGVEVRMHAPTLWAALQLAAQRPDGSTPSVLISLTQAVDSFASRCADLMDTWPQNILPNYQAADKTNDLWSSCLASAADYFTVASVEYRLLKRGIAVHHGKMPGLLARRLKALIDGGYIRVIIATSTLSEGVNIPVNYLLLPNLFRATETLNLQEFTNLIGRAGRPGVATEGSALVVLPERTAILGQRRIRQNRQWNAYESLVTEVESMAGKSAPADNASSPLKHLLHALEAAWKSLAGNASTKEFTIWLEQTAIMDGPDTSMVAYNYLDNLDAFLIAVIQEIEELRQAELSPDQIETELIAVWRQTYAFAASHEEARLGRIWLTRGRVIKTHYPGSTLRRRIYKTSLSPRSAKSLLKYSAVINAQLQKGIEYADWTTEKRFAFICDVLDLLSQVPVFQIATKIGRKNVPDWTKLLRWWLAKSTLATHPETKEITSWYNFVAQNFIYKGAWGLGSIIGLLLDETEDGQQVRALEIDDWPRSGLPWIAFWLKELITWGTLDPVAAFLLARGAAIDRPQAEAKAEAYYEQAFEMDANDKLDPRLVRKWVESQRVEDKPQNVTRNFTIDVKLARPVSDYSRPRLTVTPLAIKNGFIWVDPAGYAVAQSRRPRAWPEKPSSFDFELHVVEKIIIGKTYLSHV